MANETSKIVICTKFWLISCMILFVLICSCTTLKHVKIYLIKSAYQGWYFALFHAHPHTLESFRTQRQGLSELYQKILKIWHCHNPKNVRFWTKKSHCALGQIGPKNHIIATNPFKKFHIYGTNQSKKFHIFGTNPSEKLGRLQSMLSHVILHQIPQI